MDIRLIHSYLVWFNGYSSDGVTSSGGHHDAEIIVFVDVEQLGLNLSVGAFRKHIEKDGKEEIALIGFLAYGHGETDGVAGVSVAVGEGVYAVVALNQGASLNVVNKYLTQ